MNQSTTPMFSDYIVYVDESGDHSLESIDQEYPVFVLSFCIFRKEVYGGAMTSAVRKLKFATFGHDMVILHEIDIRKKRGAFAKLGKEARDAFLNALTDIIDAADFKLVAVVIDKHKLKARYSNPGHPYHLAMEFGLERIFRFLKSVGQADRMTYLVCEARGAKEDKELELEFRRICDGANFFHDYCRQKDEFGGDAVCGPDSAANWTVRVAPESAKPGDGGFGRKILPRWWG
jgi:hypothetical protein